MIPPDPAPSTFAVGMVDILPFVNGSAICVGRLDADAGAELEGARVIGMRVQSPADPTQTLVSFIVLDEDKVIDDLIAGLEKLKRSKGR